MGMLELQEKLKLLTKKLSKDKTTAKKKGLDYTVFQQYNDTLKEIKAVKKLITAFEMSRMNAYGDLSIKNSNNGRTQY